MLFAATKLQQNFTKKNSLNRASWPTKITVGHESCTVENIEKAYFKEKLPKEKHIKNFGKFREPYFSNKGVCNDEKIIVVEREQILRKRF